MSDASLINDLQTHGMRLVDPRAGQASRRGGAGPSDHKAITIGDRTVMIPVHTAPSFDSPFVVEAPDATGAARVTKHGAEVAVVRFPTAAKFYQLKTADGIPYSHIAALHSKDVLATTVLQTCIRYESRKKTCQFCAIGQSLAAGRTIAHKTPEQLAEVAKAAVELDGVTHMVLTTARLRARIAAQRCSVTAPAPSRPPSICRCRDNASRRRMTPGISACSTPGSTHWACIWRR